MLRYHKIAIWWAILVINPSLCMHKIFMEDDYKVSIEHQHLLNSEMQEMVEEIL